MDWKKQNVRSKKMADLIKKCIRLNEIYIDYLNRKKETLCRLVGQKEV